MIFIAGDKHGLKVIGFVENYLKKRKIPYENLGAKTDKEDIRLEEMIPRVVKEVRENEENRGILVCGTGVGVEIGANKFSGIRAVLATNEKVAQWSVVYDKCNVLCLLGWDNSQENVNKILDSWFSAKYDGDKKRLKMMKAFDTWH